MNNNSDISRYGQNMAEFCRLINENASKFSQKPIGPIGTYITFKSNVGDKGQLSKLLQVQLGTQLLKGFIVANRNDRNLLNKLMDEVTRMQRSHKPFNVTIVTWKNIGRKVDIARQRVNKGSGFSVLVDYFDFKHDEVFNVICDKVKPEKIIITTDQLAQTMFASKETVPKNTILAITETFNKYSPPTRGNYSNFYIEEPNYPITLLVQAKHISMQFKEKHDENNTKMRELEAQEKEIQKRQQDMRLERNKIIDQINANNKKLGNLNQNKTRLSNMLFEKKRNNRDWDAGIEAYESENRKLKAEKEEQLAQKRVVRMEIENIEKVLEKSQKFFDDENPHLVQMKLELSEMGKLLRTNRGTVIDAQSKFDEYETKLKEKQE